MNGFANTIFDDNAPTPIASVIGTYTGTFRPEPGVTSVAVASGGCGGYEVGDVLDVLGGAFSTQAQLTVTAVSGGAITGVSILTAGAYSVDAGTPAAVADVTTPAATGATFKLTYGALSVLNGKNYLGTWTLSIKDTGVAGTLNGWSLNPITVTPNPQVIATATPVVAGSGYNPGEILTLQGGTITTPAQFIVTSVNGTGGITSVALYQPGLYSVVPVVPMAVTGPAGAGAMFTVAATLDDVLSSTMNRTFRIGFATQTLSGTYTIVVGSRTPTREIYRGHAHEHGQHSGRRRQRPRRYVVGDLRSPSPRPLHHPRPSSRWSR